MSWNQTRLAAGIAAALLLGGTALAQGAAGSSGATGTAPGGSTATGTPSATGGSDTASPSRSDTTGSTDTTPTPSGSTATGTSTATGSSAHEGMASSGKVDKGLEQGLQKLHAANQAEIQMGQMAAQTAQDDQVKQFAQKMVDDHSKNDQKLEQLAQQAGVTLQGSAFDKANEKSEKEMAKLHKPGAGFDKAYMSHQVKDHEKDLHEVASLAKRAHREKQTELASFLDETHSAMQGHLKMAKSIEKATRSEQRQGRRGAARSSSGMSSPRSRSTGADTGAPGMGTGSDTNTGTSTGAGSSETAPSGTGSPGAEEQPHRP